MRKKEKDSAQHSVPSGRVAMEYSGLFADREAHERALKTLFASFCPNPPYS
jgi:hypothetical protein